jgi:hypothetical protein
MSCTVDLRPGPPVSLASTSQTAVTIDVEATSADFASSVVSLDMHAGPVSSVTLDATVDEIVARSVVAGGIQIDARAAAVAHLAPGAAAVITLEIDGCSGPPGPPGPSGEGGVYRHVQASAADTWTINHDLGFYPAVTATDTAGSVVYGDVLYLDEHSVVVSFTSPFAGFANLS